MGISLAMKSSLYKRNPKGIDLGQVFKIKTKNLLNQ